MRTHPATPIAKTPASAVSPLVLSDQLITLAEQANQAGYGGAARRLVSLARRMLDERPLPGRFTALEPARPVRAVPPQYPSPVAARRPGH